MNPKGFDRPLSRHHHQHGLFGDGDTIMMIGIGLIILVIVSGKSYFEICAFSLVLLIILGISEAVRGIGSTIVELYDEGLIHRHRDEMTIYRWEQIHRIYDAKLTEYTTRHLLFDRPETRLNTILEIQRSDGKTLRVDRYFQNSRELYKSVLTKHQDYWLPKCIDQIDRGEAIDFGPLRVTATSISSGDGSIPLKSIIDMRLERLGNIEFLVPDASGHVEWVRLADQTLPNRHLLEAVIIALQNRDNSG